jgi:AraC-like DNA-binding protein
MIPKGAKSGGEGLERSCRQGIAGWVSTTDSVGGIELLQAWFSGRAYSKHRHDTYAIGLTDSGVQVFEYRGAVHASTPGKVVVLYPDEMHDGRAGTEEGFGYRIVYIEPSCLSEALEVLSGRPYPLPFLSNPVSTSAKLSKAVHEAFELPINSLAVDSLVTEFAEALMNETHGFGDDSTSRHINVRMVERVRQFLEAEKTRVVRSSELEAISGLTRYDLARQFRLLFGTSPYRYLLMRRLDLARQQIHLAHPLVEVAYESGFADQAHFTRLFRAAFGMTPACYAALRIG